MKIEVISNVISTEEINTLMTDIDPKETAKDMHYFVSTGMDYGVKKIGCKEHSLISTILSRLSIPFDLLENASIAYYPTKSYNGMHCDNSSILNGVVTKHKEWSHTAIVFLNDNFKGGELCYPEQGCTFSAVPGSMVIAPAGIEAPHYVNVVEEGERFTLVLRFK